MRTGESVAQSEAVVVVISPHSLGSSQVTKEIVRAHESDKQFIPILRDITHTEFQQRQPEWREAIGSATSLRVPQDGIEAIIPAIMEGVRLLGIQPSAKADSARISRISKALEEIRALPASQERKTTPSEKPTREIKKAKSRKPLVITLASVIVIAIIILVVFLPRDGLTSNPTTSSPSVTSTSTPPLTLTTTSPATTKATPIPTPTPTPSPTTAPVLKPDLTVLDISWSPVNPSAGEPVIVTAAVVNQGKTSADPSYLYFFVDGVYKENVQIDKIPAGATLIKTFKWTAHLEKV